MIARGPALSVVVPISDDVGEATTILAALAASDLPRWRWELIVVATGKLGTALPLAAQHANAIVRLTASWNASSAYVCNRGAAIARAPVIVFLGRDVSVRPDTLTRIAGAFFDGGLSALVGTIAPAPRSAGIPTRYRSAVREWMHLRGKGPSEHFATYCGAIRSGAFFAAGQLDEWQRAPLGCASRELGLRLRALGHRIELRDDVRVDSRRPSSWFDAVRPLMIVAPTPPWMPRSVASPDEALARLRRRESRLAAILTLAVMLCAYGVARNSRVTLFAAGALAALVALSDLPMIVHALTREGAAVGLAAVPLRVAGLLAFAARVVRDTVRFHAVGEPHTDPGVEALHEVGARAWPPTPTRPRIGEPTVATATMTAAPRQRVGDAP